jgi:hypothetical protein
VFEHLQEREALDGLVVRPAALEVLLPIEMRIRRATEREVFGWDVLDELPVVAVVGATL